MRKFSWYVVCIITYALPYLWASCGIIEGLYNRYACRIINKITEIEISCYMNIFGLIRTVGIMSVFNTVSSSYTNVHNFEWTISILMLDLI
jgi:hypothetical protein